MKDSRYSMVILFRVILICINCLWLVWLYKLTGRPATTLFALILLILQTISLINYHNRILRVLSDFLVFLQENDTTLAYTKKSIEGSFKGLTYNLNKINEKIQVAGIERERQYQYLQAIVKQIDTGIIAYNQEGKVEIFNQAARDLLGIHSLSHIKTLSEISPELAEFMLSGNKIPDSPLVIRRNNSKYILAIKSGSLKFEDKLIRLISFQNIRPELEARELEAWRKLIRIQRHEIINSITPVTTLTTAIKRRLLKGKNHAEHMEITDEQFEDIIQSVDVIEDRSRGLIDFVERFRNLTDVPVLRIESVGLKRVMDRIAILYGKELSSKKINLTVGVEPENLIIKADEKLLEQALINLVKNSLEAIRHDGGTINIKAYRNMQNVNIIQIIDNGTGIDKVSMESIFIPSFTTKEKGSGIGLSITRQIIQLHRGSIEVRSTPGIETVFEIVLPDIIS
jgi:nitrogen fixation/metabolism regulation signal transduction histidine kinase